MNEGIRKLAQLRGISRLCHFTPSRNLCHIAAGETGILATQRLQADERSVYTPTDLERLDGYVSHISCSIEFPNAWYFSKARQKEVLFKDWAVILIKPDHLWAEGTLFCARNAAAGRGFGVGSGERTFAGLYEPSVPGAYGKTRSRGTSHLASCPTDEQAEVLVPDRIDLTSVLAIAVYDESQAKREAARLRQLGISVSAIRFIIAPHFYDARTLSAAIRGGKYPKEAEWVVR